MAMGERRRMRKIFVILFLLSTIFVFAQDRNVLALNGHDWKEMSGDAKLGYLIGFFSGTELSVFAVDQVLGIEAGKAMAAILIMEVKVEDEINLIDKFYKNHALEITVITVILILNGKVKNDKTAEL